MIFRPGCAARTFPGCHRPLDYSKENVCVRRSEADKFTQTPWITDPELGAQVPEFIAQLIAGNLQPRTALVADNAPAIEAVTTPLGFIGYGGKVSSNGRQRIACFAEALELWVMAIAVCLAAQHLLRQQALAPQGNKTFGIEIARVQAPQAHGYLIGTVLVSGQMHATPGAYS